MSPFLMSASVPLSCVYTPPCTSYLWVPIKNIERELICPCCKELFTHPLILPCQHSVCHKCAKELLLSRDDAVSELDSEFSNPATPVSSPRIRRLSSASVERLDRLTRTGWKRTIHSQGITTFPCPSCKYDIDLGERGLSGLFRNFTLETIVERYRQAARAAVAIMCNLCKPPPQEATKSCMDCKASYCNECFKLHHPWGTPKAQHEYVGPTTNFRPKILMCPEHDMEKVTMYCEVCRRPVCHLCKLGGSHANHKVTSMSSAYKALKEKLSKSIGYLISKEDQVKTQIFQLEHMIEQTESNGEKAKREATDLIDGLCAILEQRKMKFIKSIEDSRSSKLEKLQNQMDEYQGMLENSGLVGYAQEVLKETDQSCFVQTAKQLHIRIRMATESLKTFQPAAEPSFTEFTLDVSREEELLKELSFTNGVASLRAFTDHGKPIFQLQNSQTFPDAPVIDLTQSRLYDDGIICWQQPNGALPVDHYKLEYRRLDQDGDCAWESTEDVCSTSKVISNLDTNMSYIFRVKGCKNSIYSDYSKEVLFHTPPAPVLRFLFDEKCGYNSDHLILNKQRDSVESVAGLPMLLSAERIVVGSYMSLNFITGDTGVTKGKYYWAFRVELCSYLVKVGVVSDTKLQEWFHSPPDINSPRYDQDSGHDSGSEDIALEQSQPFTFVTIGMKRLFIPKGSASSSTESCKRSVSTPSRIGICLDYDKGKVNFYNADTMQCLYERRVECSGTMYPAFGLMGGGAVHLDELITLKESTKPGFFLDS
ncbi:E3 ubiquitin-protein ligase TRIM36 isoform X6 [Chiloscyllium plagiosum]|uniref:E3 ubiquitin-protein ligase TRIM36 isoform X6 n=1 Tax=Chiloscyllium plagiosum TaxID=36176 RepID=UPI001CB841B4|nr:E3 ubiquitin-protein ligase TRIM36 isoform X6 [Chiloscyllium plagiosum]